MWMPKYIIDKEPQPQRQHFSYTTNSHRVHSFIFYFACFWMGWGGLALICLEGDPLFDDAASG